jgi:DNA-directed RNA polymerase subunit RPC12/RpoP
VFFLYITYYTNDFKGGLKMENLKEKVSYLKGLSDGLGITHDTKEGKLLIAIIDVLDDMSIAVDDLQDTQEELDEYVEAIDEDLAKLEDDIYEEDDEEDEDDGYIEFECPNCHETVFLDEDMIDDDDVVRCPNCDEPIHVECSCDGDCGCDHDDCNC